MFHYGDSNLVWVRLFEYTYVGILDSRTYIVIAKCCSMDITFGFVKYLYMGEIRIYALDQMSIFLYIL